RCPRVPLRHLQCSKYHPPARRLDCMALDGAAEEASLPATERGSCPRGCATRLAPPLDQEKHWKCRCQSVQPMEFPERLAPAYKPQTQRHRQTTVTRCGDQGRSHVRVPAQRRTAF